MSSSYITSIITDSLGMLWIGTHGGGVSIYDGATILTLKKENGLSNDAVISLAKDKTGKVWMSTFPGGITSYDGKEFRIYNEEHGLPTDEQLTTMCDSKGNMWFGANEGGVLKYDGSKFEHFGLEQGLQSTTVRSIVEDAEGNMWFGSDSGITVLKGDSMYTFGRDLAYIENHILCMLHARNGDVWIGNDQGLTRYDGKIFHHYNTGNGLPDVSITCLTEDEGGGIWMGTYEGGLCVFKEDTFSYYSRNEGIDQTTIRSIFCDKSGLVWVGTDGGGVYKIKHDLFQKFTEAEGLSNNIVPTALADTKGNYWFGTNGGGLNKYDGENFTWYREENGLISDYVSTLMEDDLGNIWVGTDFGGLCIFDQNQFLRYDNSEILTNAFIVDMVKDSLGNVWLATAEYGLLKLHGDSLSIYNHDSGIKGAYIGMMLQLANGDFWFSAEFGVYKYQDGKFMYYEVTKDVLENYSATMMEDSKGRIWFGTLSEGALILDDTSYYRIDEIDGLTSSCVWSMTEDDWGRIWLSTEHGISVLEEMIPENNNKKGVKPEFFVSQFRKDDGLKSEDFFQSSVIGHDNKFWVGSGKALTMLDLNHFHLPNSTPSIHLKNVVIKDQPADYRRQLLQASANQDKLDSAVGYTYTDVACFYNFPLGLVLPANLNHLTFEFVGIDRKSPEKVKYRYMLEGIEKEWSKTTTTSEADYRNLPHGTYTFKVQAMGTSQVWTEPLVYTFKISPPWWKTYWFRTLALIAFGSIIIFIILFRERKLKRQRDRLEKTVHARTLEVVKEKLIVEEQKKLIEVKHKEITDSLNYAQRIQKNLLAEDILLIENLKEHFVFFKPKDIVSGDFYWAHKFENNQFILMVGDSTGHGVPGAIMSMLNVACLHAVVGRGYTMPDEILNATREHIIELLHKQGVADGGRDGMDCGLMIFDFDNLIMYSSAAHIPLWIVRQNPNDTEDTQLIEIKPNRFPVGKYSGQNQRFSLTITPILEGDMIYAVTDGYPDQFGGPQGKKFKNEGLRNLLLNIASKPALEQRAEMISTFFDWKGTYEQVDDVCVVGIRV